MKPNFLLLPILFLSFFQVQAQTKIIGFKSHSGSMTSFDPASAPGDYGVDERMIEESRRQDSIRQAQMRLDSLIEEAKQDSLRREAELRRKAEYEAAQKAAAEQRKKQQQSKQEKQRLKEGGLFSPQKKETSGAQNPLSQPSEKPKGQQGDPSPLPDNKPGNTQPFYLLLIVPVVFWMSKKLG